MDLVERRRELAELERLLDRAGAGSGAVLVVAGPPGSGRTALADVGAATAREQGFEVRGGRWPCSRHRGRRWASATRCGWGR
ncbi:ATP-binding protein [Pseudonocardia xinjiangensis]|uniref:ATP-binding protein n=1 Tax=Pseudonocardia xinjiangensis TaxID=75289 RepID=UPI003D8F4153